MKKTITQQDIENAALAEEHGYQNAAYNPEGGMMNQSWRKNQHRALTGDRIGEVQARELAENEKFKEINRKIREIVGDSDPFTGAVVSKPVQQRSPLGLEDLDFGDTGGHADEFLSEDMTPARPEKPKGRWMIEHMVVTTKQGKRIPVWKLVESNLKMQIPHPFRLEAAAQRVLSVLNRTGNPSDPRVNALIEAELKHINLLKQIRMTRESIKEGNTRMKPKLQQLLVEFDQINSKLGI